MRFRPMSHRTLLLMSFLLTVLMVVIVDSFRIPNPNVVLLTGIVYFSFLGGFSAGSISASIVVLYSVYFFSIPGYILHFTPDNLKKIIVIAAFIPIMVLIVGILKKRYDQKTKELETANAELKLVSTLDPLTGIFNRRYFDEVFLHEFSRAVRDGNSISLLMVDIDFFKDYNDVYGHIAGDICLKKVTQIISQILHRPGDVVARFGGEEFVVLLPGTDHTGASFIAEKIISSVHSKGIPHVISNVCPVLTVSVGVGTMIPSIGCPPLKLLERADKSLYLAKSRGRNQAASLPEE